MKFKHLFYDNTIDFRKISKKGLVTSIIIGLLSAFFIYCTFYVFREGFRLMSFGYENAPNIISDPNRDFYNFFFASLSLIFGNSIFISFLLKTPRAIFSKRNYKRQRVLVNQTFLNGNFIYWFGKMAIVFMSLSMSFIDFQFLPDFYWVFILLILVMYLETWKTLVQVFGNKKYKWLLIHFLIISVLSFGLSKIDVVDYKKLDASSIASNPSSDLPHSMYSNNGQVLRYPILKLKLAYDKNNNLVIFSEAQIKYSFDNLNALIMKEKASLREEMISRLLVSLSADKNLELKHIKALEAKCFENGIYKIRYEVKNPNPLTERFASVGFSKQISALSLDFVVKSNMHDTLLQQSPPPINFSAFKRVVDIEVDDIIKFNNETIEEKRLVRAFQNKIDSITLFQYHLNPNTTYQKYITVISAHNKAIYNLRQNKASFDISKSKYYLNKEEKEKFNKLKQKFRINIKEINTSI